MQVLRFVLPVILVAWAAYRVRSWRRRRPASGEALLRQRQAETAAAKARAVPPAPGMLPAGRQDTTMVFPPEPELVAALAGAGEGRWEPAAAALAWAGRDWDLRYGVLRSLSDAAARDDAWLRAWQQARPDDPDAATVEADSLVWLAWQVRGSGTADRTQQEQFEAFRRVLGQARAACRRAAELAPDDDPTPYAVELNVGLGLGYPHEEFRALFAEVTSRAPRHHGGHGAALQYWCEKWRGSAAAADEFARTAVAGAAPGELMSALPLTSWYEHHELRKPASAAGAAGSGPGSDAASDELAALVDAGLADAAAATGDSRQLRVLRHLLAYYLYRLGRHAEAVEQFRLVDGHVRAVPWMYSPATAERYTAVRDSAFHKASGEGMITDGVSRRIE